MQGLLPAALLSPEPRGQPELSPQELVELQELRFPSRSSLTQHGDVCTPQREGFLKFVVSRSRERKVLGRMWVRWMSMGFGHRSGDRLRTETALNFTQLPLKSLLFQTAREKCSSRYSAGHLCCPGVLGSPGSEPRIFTWELWQPQDVTSQQSHLAAGTGMKGVCVSRWLLHHGGLNLSFLQLFFHEQTSIPPIALKTEETAAFIFGIWGLFIGLGCGVFP